MRPKSKFRYVSHAGEITNRGGRREVLSQKMQRSAVASSATPESPPSVPAFRLSARLRPRGPDHFWSGRGRGARASTVVIAEGAQVEGDVVAEELTIGGHVKGTIHANRVNLNSTAVVEGDFFHRTLAIEENARFEGMSRREENTIDTPSRGGYPHVSIDGNRKGNGAPEGLNM
jgi:Polymer-forming cytoskeletal